MKNRKKEIGKGIDIEKLLLKVEKPARYIGGELNEVKKNPAEVKTNFAFAFPDTYEIGMSYMGLQIIYNLLNRNKDVYCQRVFAPAIDMEAEMRRTGIPLFMLETGTPVKSADILGFTMQYEMSFTNILNMLDLAEIPLLSAERGEEDPFVIAGGPCAFNPEPMADFIDFFVIGDGEEILERICKVHGKWKEENSSKEEFLKRICLLSGVYVPSFYKPVYDENGAFSNMEKLYDNAPKKIMKNIVIDLSRAPFPENPVVPLIEVVHDRSVIEIFRGCTRGCRFCQAGMIYRPVRERPKETIKSLFLSQLKSAGYDEVSLLSLSTSDYSEIEPLVVELMELCEKKNVALSLPSMRLDSFSFRVLKEIGGYKKTNLTFAPEAGSQRLRNVINKSISDDDIYNSVRQAIELGWNGMKLYFMIGLPTETHEDLDGISNIARNIMDIYYDFNGGKKNARFNLNISVSNFVPKAHTPFQWSSQDDLETFVEKQVYLREKLRGIKGVTFSYHGAENSVLEGALARGDRKVSKAIKRAWELGCKFDSWREHFNYNLWVQAFDEVGIDFKSFTRYKGFPGGNLPWNHIDTGVSDTFLLSEWKRAEKGLITADCRNECLFCGINEYVDCEMAGSKDE
ncbi:MAG: TIGR03960 family B12-binding radical SAM protein [Anaerovoracaceae bacterium]|jgi:radical SAM family uncharacterized protein